MRLTENMIIARAKTSDLSKIDRINLWGCDLTDISIVENMINIETLALSINNLSCLQPLEACMKLQVLYLRKNNISDFNQLKYLQNLPKLTELWLAENPCAVQAGPNYRARVIKMLPRLKKLDDKDVTFGEIEDAKKLNLESLETASVTSVTQDLNPRQETVVQNFERTEKSSPVKSSYQETIRTESVQQIETVNLSPRQSETYNQQRYENQRVVQTSMNSSRTQFQTFTQQQQPPQQQQQQQQQYHLSQNQNLSLPPMQYAEDCNSQRSRLSLPVSLPQQTNYEQSGGDMQPYQKPQSMNQIPPLKLVLQIEQNQESNPDYPDGQEQDWPTETPRNRYDCMSERIGLLNKNRIRQQPGSMTSRTRVPQAYYEDSGWESTQQCNPQIQSGNGSQTQRTAIVSRSSPKRKNPNWQEQKHTIRSPPSDRSAGSSTLQSPTSSRRYSNVSSAIMCVIPELNIESLQVLEHSIQCRLDELNEG